MQWAGMRSHQLALGSFRSTIELRPRVPMDSTAARALGSPFGSISQAGPVA